MLFTWFMLASCSSCKSDAEEKPNAQSQTDAQYLHEIERVLHL